MGWLSDHLIAVIVAAVGAVLVPILKNHGNYNTVRTWIVRAAALLEEILKQMPPTDPGLRMELERQLLAAGAPARDVAGIALEALSRRGIQPAPAAPSKKSR